MKASMGTRAQESTMIDQEDLVNAESELTQLRQRYRIVENDRKAYLDESSNILRKQRKYIQTLQKEKEEFGVMAGRLANQKMDMSDQSSLTLLVDTCKERERQIAEEMDQLQLLQKKLSMLREARENRMRIHGGYDAEQARHVGCRKRIRTLENKLDKKTVDFNKALAKNHSLRDRIQQIRRELALYKKSYNKVFVEQAQLKEEMNDVIEFSTAAYDSREECLARMSTIRDRNDKDEATYNNQVKELKRILEHEQKLKDFMNLKTQDRSGLLKSAAEAAKRKLAKSSKTCLHQEEIKSYEFVFERIKLHRGEFVLDRLVRAFLHQESVAFALFNYNSELECEVETMTLLNRSLKKDIKQFKEQGVQLEGKRVNIMKTLEVDLAQATIAADGLEGRGKICRKQLEQILARVVSFIRKLGCDASVVTNRLGCGGGINDKNAMTYLGLAEFVCNDILLVEAYYQHRSAIKNLSKRKVLAAQQGSMVNAKLRPKSPVVVTINAPSIGADGETSTDIERIAGSNMDVSQPLSPEDIRAKIVQAIEQKREYDYDQRRPGSFSKSDWQWQAPGVEHGSPEDTPHEVIGASTHSASVDVLLNAPSVSSVHSLTHDN